MSTTYIILGVLAVIIIAVIAVYNGLVKLATRTKEAWADIEVQLKRRYDLIPNLVNTVKGYAEHGMAENMLTGALKSIFALSEAYPDLKANQNFLELQRQLADTEDKIQAARR